ncbi:MAG: hypothetical protein Q8Q09_00915 [Deltaproteobacteria bacterium]|nr:hypothetical protein [Deltaproteobacteria bacterium]
MHTVYSRSWIAVSTAFLLILSTHDAHAIRPDLDGERGLEAQVALGVGGFSNGTQRLVTPADTTGPTDHQGTAIVGPSVGLRISAGWRFHGALSAGLSLQWQHLGAMPLSGDGGMYDYSASALAVGAYARLYPMAFVSSVPRTARVAFTGMGDLRRLDPWVSLGFEFFDTLGYGQRLRAAPTLGANFSRGSVGIPVGIGLEYRVLPMLAVGLTTHLTPWIGAWNTSVAMDIVSGNPRTTSNSYNGTDPLNLAWNVALSVRYTFTP